MPSKCDRRADHLRLPAAGKWLRRTAAAFAVAVTLGCWLPAFAVQYQMPVTFGGYTNRPEILTNFPVLVVLSNNVGGSGFSFANQPFSSTNGWDLRFRDGADTTNLNYEIESWNTGGTCYVWVQVPAIQGNGMGSIVAKWGGDSAQQASTTNGSVWIPSYRGVWHMANGTGSSASDATTNNHAGSLNGPAWTNGPLGSALSFDGVNDTVTLGSELWDSDTQGSVSAWVYPRASGGALLVATTVGVDNKEMRFQQTGSMQTWLNPTFNDAAAVSPALTSNQWYFLTYTMQSSKWIIYVNGVSNALTWAAGGNNGRWFNSIASSGTQTYQMGDLNATYHDWMNGIADELRVESVGHSSNWVWATYQNMASNTVFSKYGTAGQDPGPAVSITGATGMVGNAAWLVGSVFSTGASHTAWGILWGTNNPGAVLTNWQSGGSVDLGSAGSVPLTNSSMVSGLTGETTYWYTYWATNAAGTNVAAPVSFMTGFVPTNYAGRMKISFTNYTRSEVLTNFPVLVTFSNNIAGSGFACSNLLSTNGWDLRFRGGADTNFLNYEIEKWDTNGTSYVWVQVPLFSNNASIWAYYGRGGAWASTQEVYTTNGATWDNGYRGVWHLKNGTTLSGADSSTNANTGTIVGSAPATNGVVDGAAGFDGTTQTINCGNPASLNPLTITVEAWVRTLANSSSYQTICSKDKFASGNERVWQFRKNNANLNFIVFTTDSTLDQSTSSAAINDGSFHHVAGTWDGTTIRTFVDGVPDGSKAFSGSLQQSQANNMFIGRIEGNNATENAYWNGSIDEVRVSGLARSTNWVWACFLNQASNTFFNTYGPAQLSTPPAISATTATPDPVGGTNTVLSVTATDSGGEAILSYLWSTTGTPPGGVTYSANGSNAAKSSTVTFTNAGSYGFQVAATNQFGLTATGTVSVTVTQTFTSLQISPNQGGTNDVTRDATLQFNALPLDQFAHVMGVTSTNWSVSASVGNFSADGLFTATNLGTAPVTVSCGALSATSTVRVVAGATHSIGVSCGANGSISPAGPSESVADGEDRAFTVTADAGYHIQDVKTNGVSVGAVSSFTFTNVTENGHTIQAVFTNFAPQVATAATATPVAVTAVSSVLSVLGSDYEGEQNLTYTWSTTGTPPAAVGFSVNASNAAKTTTVTFAAAGTYGFQVAVRDQGGLAVTGLVNVAVSLSPVTVAVTPPVVTMGAGLTNQFTAASTDQFGHVMSGQSYVWSVSGGGTVDSSGLFTAGVTGGGPYTVTAANGSVSGTAVVTVVASLIWDGTTNNWETQHWRDQTNGLNTPVANLSYTATSGVVQVSSVMFPAALSIAGAGRLAVTATGSGMGPVTLAGGTVEHNSGSAFTLTSSNGYTLVSGTTSTVNAAYYNGVNTFTLAGLIGGGGSLMKVGPGTLYLGGSNAFTGGFIMTTGYLSVANSDAFGVTGSTRGPLTWTGGKIDFANSGLNIGNPVRIGGGFASQLLAACGGLVTFSGDVTLLNDVWFQPNVYGTIAALSGNISGGHGLSTFDQITRLSGSNTYTGVTTVESGTLQLYASSGGNAVPGNLTVNAGNVVLYASDRIADPATVTLAGTACLALCDPGIPGSTQYETIGALEGSGGYVTVVNTGSDGNPNNKCTLTISKTAGISTYGGVLADSVNPNARTHTLSLIKSGVGTQVLAGASTYSGATTVSNGVLLVNGSLSAASSGIVVRAGGTLGGTGTISRVVSNLAGSVLSPGSGANMGVLTVSNLYLSAGSRSEFDLGTAGASDAVTVLGNVTLGGTIAMRPAPGIRPGSYTIMTYTGTLSGSISLLQMSGGWTGLIDTSTPGQVKLIVKAAGTIFCFQ